jgi:CheY-like chemotaxis protein
MPREENLLIVCIEDTPEMIDLLHLVLADENLMLVAATSGRGGLELIRQHQPDLVLLDLMLPDIDGWQVLQEMREDPDIDEIPVIVVSVRNDRCTERMQCDEAKQLAGYVVKPFSIHHLRRIVWKALENSPRTPS